MATMPSTTGDLVAAPGTFFGSMPRWRVGWVLLLAAGLLASVPAAYHLMRAPASSAAPGHLGGPR